MICYCWGTFSSNNDVRFLDFQICAAREEVWAGKQEIPTFASSHLFWSAGWFSHFLISIFSCCHFFIFFIYFHIASFPLFWSAGWFSHFLISIFSCCHFLLFILLGICNLILCLMLRSWGWGLGLLKKMFETFQKKKNEFRGQRISKASLREYRPSCWTTKHRER